MGTALHAIVAEVHRWYFSMLTIYSLEDTVTLSSVRTEAGFNITVPTAITCFLKFKFFVFYVNYPRAAGCSSKTQPSTSSPRFVSRNL